MTMNTAAVAIVAAVTLAGCSGGAAKPAAKPTATSSTSSTTTTTTALGLTTAQVASVVAQQRGKLEALKKDLDGCPTLDEVQQTACAYVVQRAPVEGDLAFKSLSNIPGSQVPDEVSGLLAQTLDAAGALASVDAKPCENTKLNERCSGATELVRVRLDQLLAKMDGWEPYS
jgi:hypothetical protein